MFEIFKRKDVVGSKDTENAQAVRQSIDTAHMAPGTRISYHPELIADLKDDHQSLVNLYTEISGHVERRDFEQASEAMNTLRHELQSHLLTENIKLYIYLVHHFEGDNANVELVKNFRRENDKIGRTAVKFLQTYSSPADIEIQVDKFSQEWAGLGEVLVQRIDREESILYPMYVEAG